MIKLPYHEVEFYWVTGRHDIAWKGYAIYNNKIYKFYSEDHTDYDAMNDSCPYCSAEWPNDLDVRTCHCENYVHVYCYLERLTWREALFVRLSKFYWEKIERPYLFWKNRDRLC